MTEVEWLDTIAPSPYRMLSYLRGRPVFRLLWARTSKRKLKLFFEDWPFLARNNWICSEVSREIAKHIREIFGNPFRPISINSSWLTSTVLALANGIYDEKAFDRMPILADALQDAGCDNADILNHCRQSGEHVRGCWLIDLLTNRK